MIKYIFLYIRKKIHWRNDFSSFVSFFKWINKKQVCKCKGETSLDAAERHCCELHVDHFRSPSDVEHCLILAFEISGWIEWSGRCSPAGHVVFPGVMLGYGLDTPRSGVWAKHVGCDITYRNHSPSDWEGDSRVCPATPVRWQMCSFGPNYTLDFFQFYLMFYHFQTKDSLYGWSL